MPLSTVGFTDNGRVDLKELEKSITADTACVLIQSPNFFGTIEDVAAIAEIAHKTRRDAGGLDRRSGFAGHRRTAARRPTSSPWKRNRSACRSASAGPTAA